MKPKSNRIWAIVKTAFVNRLRWALVDALLDARSEILNLPDEECPGCGKVHRPVPPAPPSESRTVN